MSNASAVTQPQGRSKLEAIEVDPHILAVIKSPSAPVGVPKSVQPPSSLPGPSGPLAPFVAIVEILRRGVGFALECQATYGDVYRMSLPGLPMVGVFDADAVQQILKNDDKAWSAAMGWAKYMFEGLDERRGNLGGLLAVDFDDHRIARKLVAPAFTTKATDGYLKTASRLFGAANAEWVSRGHVSFKAETRTLFSRVANEIFMGIRDPETLKKVDRALTDFWYSQFAVAKNPWISPAFRRGRKGLAVMLDTILAMVPERRASGGDDLFSHLCSVTDRDNLDDEEIVRIFMNILAAAFDTTAAGLASMAYMLAKHPEWQERLREEAFAVGDGPIDTAAARSMKVCELVWKETLRIMPVATFVPRRPLRSVEVGGHKLPAGTLALVATGAMGLHPKWWNEPAKFDPERFLPERAEDKKHPAIYIPFGAGPHTCIGMQLASMEVKAYWHDLLRRCRIRLTKDYEAVHTTGPLGTVSGDVALTLEPLH
jgi:cytochrome P450